jgi:hypothetical protein
MAEEGFEATIIIKLNGGNTRVQKEEIMGIFECAKARAKEMNIEAELEMAVR